MMIQERLRQLFAEKILSQIAGEVGTPCYVYSADRILENYHRLRSTLVLNSRQQLCYSVKASSNLSILKLLASQGAWFEVVSLGELQRVLAAGIEPERVVFTGMGKRYDELAFAICVGVKWLIVENPDEIWLINDIAMEAGRKQQVALRINPCIEPDTHVYLATGAGDSKFGMGYEQALGLVRQRAEMPGVEIQGVHVHVGSMIFEVEPYRAALQLGLRFTQQARSLGCPMRMLDLGGGFGVPYQAKDPEPPLQAIAELIHSQTEEADLEVLFEPGRAIVADAGILLTRVLYHKVNASTSYIVVDAGMNDLIRPALYGAFHEAWVVTAAEKPCERPSQVCIAGPVCESADILGWNLSLPSVRVGDLIAIAHAGAYGMSMASNYNSRPRGAEVLIQGPKWWVIRPRETLESLWASELQALSNIPPPDLLEKQSVSVAKK